MALAPDRTVCLRAVARGLVSIFTDILPVVLCDTQPSAFGRRMTTTELHDLIDVLRAEDASNLVLQHLSDISAAIANATAYGLQSPQSPKSATLQPIPSAVIGLKGSTTRAKAVTDNGASSSVLESVTRGTVSAETAPAVQDACNATAPAEHPSSDSAHRAANDSTSHSGDQARHDNGPEPRVESSVQSFRSTRQGNDPARVLEPTKLVEISVQSFRSTQQGSEPARDLGPTKA